MTTATPTKKAATRKKTPTTAKRRGLPANKPSNGLAALAGEIRHEVKQAERHWKDAVAHAIRAGELLTEAKSQLEHGDWLPWLKANFAGSERTASNYMRLAANRQRVADLPTVRQAVAVLAEGRAPLSKSERHVLESFQSAKAMAAEHGKRVTHEHVGREVAKLGRKTAAEAAFEKGDFDAAEKLGSWMRPARRDWGGWSPRPPAKLPPERIPAALAASERARTKSDLIRVWAGLPPVPESPAVQAWRRRLDEGESGGAPSRMAKLAAELRKVRGDLPDEDRGAVDAVISALLRVEDAG